MILGMPVISSFAGGTSSLIENDKDGILIQDGDPWVLAGSIKECFENYEEFIKFGRYARKKALVRHDQNSIAKNLIGIYKSILYYTKSESECNKS